MCYLRCSTVYPVIVMTVGVSADAYKNNQMQFPNAVPKAW